MKLGKAQVNNPILIKNLSSIVPNKKALRKINQLYNTDPDYLFIIVNHDGRIVYHQNQLKYAIIMGLEDINCMVLGEGEYYDPQSNSVSYSKAYLKKINKQATENLANHLAKKNKREKLAERDNYICYICGRKTNLRTNKQNNDFFDNMTIDHIVPKSKGGKSNIKNFKCCCRFCNSIKSNRLYTNDLKQSILKLYKLMDDNNIQTFSELAKNKNISKKLNKELARYDNRHSNDCSVDKKAV